MNDEMNSLWMAMKDRNYARKLQELRESVEICGDVDQAFHQILNMVIDSTHAETGTFWYYDRSDGSITPKAVYKGGNLGNISLKLGEGVVGQVIKYGKSEIIEDCQADPRWAGKVDAKTGFCTKTMICAPIIVEGETFGAVQIINKVDNNNFDDQDLKFVDELTVHISNLLAHQLLCCMYVGQKGSKMVILPHYATFKKMFGINDAQAEQLFLLLCDSADISLPARIKLQHYAKKIASLLK